MRSDVAGAVALIILTSAATPGHAQERESCDVRVHAIAQQLDRDAHRTHVWYWAWMAAGATLIVGQGTLAALVGPGNFRNELIVGGAAAVFIPTSLLVHPPLVLRDARELDERRATGPLDDPCLVLPGAAQRLYRDADDQAFSTGWFAHTFIIGGNVVLGLLLGVGLHDWPGGVKQLLGGSLVGELQILTLPTGVLKMQGLGLAGTF
jgi:hypothetical protein